MQVTYAICLSFLQGHQAKISYIACYMETAAVTARIPL